MDLPAFNFILYVKRERYLHVRIVKMYIYFCGFYRQLTRKNMICLKLVKDLAMIQVCATKMLYINVYKSATHHNINKMFLKE